MNDPQNPESPWAWKPTALDPATEDFSPDAAARFTAQLDQENQYSPSMNTLPVPEEHQVEWLIDRVVKVVPESAQMGTEPLSTIASVLAQLYQAQALQGIDGLLFGIDQKLERLLPGIAAPGKAEASELNWQAEAHRLSEALDRIACGIRYALDPELSRQEIVGMLKDLHTERFIRHR